MLQDFCTVQVVPPGEAVDTIMEAGSKSAHPATALQVTQSLLQQHQQRRHRLLGGLAALPGAGHVQAAGHLPLQLIRGGSARVGSPVQRWVVKDAQVAQRGDSMQLLVLLDHAWRWAVPV